MARVSRRQTLGLGLGAGLSVTMLSGHEEAQAAPTNTTCSALLLVNDIYKMSDDKPRRLREARGGREERAARNVPMLFCHAGDTFSPSLMSGFDQGAHIVELTNMIKPDVFVPATTSSISARTSISSEWGNRPSLFRRQYAPGGRVAHPRHEGLGGLHPWAGEGRRARHRPHGRSRHVAAGRFEVRARDRGPEGAGGGAAAAGARTSSSSSPIRIATWTSRWRARASPTWC